jgi:hypothetical protein
VSAWLRRNRWALIGLVVLIPAALAAAMSISLLRYYGDLADRGTLVAAGETGDYIPGRPLPEEEDAPPLEPSPPAVIGLTDYLVVPWDTDSGREVGLVEGTEAVSALIHVDATGVPEDAFSCDAILTLPGPGGERVWTTAGGSDIDYYPSGDLTAYCELNSGEAFDWEAVFVVPEGVGDDADLVITGGAFQSERVLRLEH